MNVCTRATRLDTWPVIGPAVWKEAQAAWGPSDCLAITFSKESTAISDDSEVALSRQS